MPRHSPHPRWRLGSRLLLLVALALLVAWPVSRWRPVSASFGRASVGAGGGWEVIAWGSVPVRIASWESNALPLWEFVGTGCSMLDAPPDGTRWRPSLTGGSMGVGTAVYSLSTMWMPAWWPPMVMGVLAGLAWWRSTRGAGAGHCANCGYSMAGLAGGVRCPECGDGGLKSRDVAK